MRILYGTLDWNTDVTAICLQRLLNEDIISIEANDYTRSIIFTGKYPDSIKGVKKKVFVIIDEEYREYDDQHYITINIKDNKVEATRRYY
jgi:hypothetical protein